MSWFLKSALTRSHISTTLSSVEEPGIQILSVDNLPTEFPLEASNHFSESLLPFVKELVKKMSPTGLCFCFGILWSQKTISKFPLPLFDPQAKGNAQHPVIARATIAENGKLAAAHSHLKDLVDKATVPKPQTTSTRKETKRVLLLGSGMVAGPLVEYLLRMEDVHVIIGK